MKVLRFGFQYWKKYLFFAIITQILGITAMVADLLLPLLSELFIDYVIGANEPETEGVFSFMLSGKYGGIHTMELFLSLAVLLMIILLTRIVLVYIKNVTNQKLGLNLETDLRVATFDKLMNLDSRTVSEYNTGELLSIMNSDTIMFKELFCRIIPNIIDNGIALVISIFLLASINPWLLIIPVLLMPFFVVALIRFRKMARTNYQTIRRNNSQMNLTVQENIEAVRLVRSFTNEELEKQKFDCVNEELKGSHINQIWLSSKFEVIFSVIRQTAYIGSIVVSAILVMNGVILVGYLVACSNYVMKIMNYITMINNQLFQMQQQVVSGNKMMEFLECESRVPDGSEKVEECTGTDIKVEHAYLEIDGKQVLKDICLDIPYGKKVGIVGETGCGKSVLLESLVRVHDLSEGSISLNGKDIRQYELESLREKYAYVFQDVYLFSDTIDSNIAYAAPDIEKEQIRTAARHAQAHGFIKNLPQSYDTVVGERGLGISGGQKQRVSIARALLKNAPVLVLDDSTSALDVNTEKKLLQDIKTYYPDRTILISAHRLSSVVDCDEILYMQNGSIVERGSFEELMQLEGHFAKVYQIQEMQKAAKNDIIEEILKGGEQYGKA